jgi:hypothetical protein
VLCLGLLAAPARALVSTVGGTTVGVQTHSAPPTTVSESSPGSKPAEFANTGAGPVLHSTNTYVVYWDPTSQYHGDWQGLINGFMHEFDASSGLLGSVFAVDSQYSDSSNQPAAAGTVYRGSYTDTDSYPGPGCKDPNPLLAGDAITCVTDQQVREELSTFIAQHGLQKGMGTIYYLLTPPGVTVCVDSGLAATHCSSNAASANSFCSYHADISPTSPTTGDANTILYAVIPWTAGGNGDYHLLKEDRKQAFDCQDGGFDPSSNPPEKKEKKREKSTKEIVEFEAKTKEEKEKQEKAEVLEEAHVQEPNQIGLGPDGSFDTGLADVITNEIAYQQQDIVTNPLLNAWQDPASYEATDECRNRYLPSTGGSVTANELTEAGSLSNQLLGTSHYYLNDAFNLAALRLTGVACIHGVSLVPKFTTPSPVNAGDIVGFDGMESDITLSNANNFPSGVRYATFTWNFGDGSPTVSGFAPGAPSANSPASSPCEAPWATPCAASTFHSYQYGGGYEVTLTVRDVGGNTAKVSHVVTIVGPPPPPPPSSSVGSQPSAGASSPGPAGAPSPGAGGAGKPLVHPSATAAVVTHSLRSALRKGLLVRYSISERVTGRFEVLLASSLARRLGLHGPPAAGLAAGTAPQTVIGKALLVTTAGGRNAVRIQFSKATAARLSHLRGATLMLRLLVRNSSSATTTLITSVTLSR